MANNFKILTVNHSDDVGGAALVARGCFKGFGDLGFDSRFLVQKKLSDDEKVLAINNEASWNTWRKSIHTIQEIILARYGQKRGIWRFVQFMEWIANPLGRLRYELGIEEFNFPGTQVFFEQGSFKPDIVHLHLPTSGFFDLRYLPKLSKEIPVFFTLHGAWLLSGHCVHSFDCERWKSGCGKCPDLTIPSAIKRDSSGFNWRLKKKIYSQSRLYVASPCHWLMDKVKQSMLATACIETRVISHGVDQSIFFPEDRVQARTSLGLDREAFIFVFSANSIVRNRWKDFELIRRALEILSRQKQSQKVIFLGLGDQSPVEKIGNDLEIRFIPYRSDPKFVADFYRSANVYLHASKADTFPNAILEALSCGIPVIGTAVGGIPEQIKGWSGFANECAANKFPSLEATGILIAKGDPISFAKAMLLLVQDDTLREQLAINAASDAADRFPIQKQVQAYLDWFTEVLDKTVVK